MLDMLVEIKKPQKVGIIPCNGEEFCEGTLTRFASRKVLDELRPHDTVTICLPLFIAGGKEDRNFAKNFPTITVDGCDKRCGLISTEKLSSRPYHSIVVSELLKEHGVEPPQSRRALTEKDRAAVDLVANEIANRVDQILKNN
ncbi:MAG: DGC domain protein [Pelotomaculum sp. PtaB.Bin104]|nr:MAG: DGC domain protein [Pelotomaculum sp. PtaB.Bin104]